MGVFFNKPKPVSITHLDTVCPQNYLRAANVFNGYDMSILVFC